MTLVDLAGHLATADDDRHRRRLIAEFLEEHRHEPAGIRAALLVDEPPHRRGAMGRLPRRAGRASRGP